MVKGVSRQAVLMKLPQDSPFEEAVFLVRSGTRPLGEKELLRQAQDAVGDLPGRARSLLTWLGAFCGGALFASLLFLIFFIR